MIRTKKFTALILAVVMMLSLTMSCMTVTHAATKMSTPKLISRTASSLTINWSPVSGATKYKVEWKVFEAGAGTYTKYASTDCAYTISSLRPGTVYKIFVYAYNGNTQIGYSSALIACTTPGNVADVDVLRDGTIKWNNVGNRCNYQIQVTKNGVTKSYTCSGTQTTYFSSHFKEDGTSTLKVRAYRVCDCNGSSHKVYGKWYTTSITIRNANA